MTDELFLDFRKRFPIFRSRIYLNSCSQGALSDAVEEAFREYLSIWREYGSPWDQWVALQEELRGEFAALIGAAPDEIAVTFSASNAIYAVASGLDYTRRSKVLLGELEFPTQCHVWLAQQARGARIEWIPAGEVGNSPEDYKARLDGSVVIVPVTHVSYRNGFRHDVHRLARAAQEAGVYFLLDDYQSCGTRPIDVRLIGADFYVTGALKYLLGCSGIAFLYARREVIECLHPTFTGWFAQRDPFAFDGRHHDPADSASRFQSGSPPVPGIYAALAGIRLLKRIGLERVYARVREMARLFVSAAAERGWKLKTPSDTEGPLIVLEAGDEQSARSIVNELGRQGIIVSSRTNGVRFSFHAYNTPDDVEAALSGLEDARRALYHPGGR